MTRLRSIPWTTVLPVAGGPALAATWESSRRNDSLPEGRSAEDPEAHAKPPGDRATLVSLVLMPLALVAVVGLAKIESPGIEDAGRDLMALRRTGGARRPHRLRRRPGGRRHRRVSVQGTGWNSCRCT